MEPIDHLDQSEAISARPTGIRYGLILGLISSVLSAVMLMTNMIDFSGTKSNWISNVITWGVSIFVFYKAIETHKEELGGFISLGRCVTLGFWVGLISGAISAAFMYVYFTLIDASFLEKTMDVMRASWEDKGMSAGDVDKVVSKMAWIISPGSLAIFGLIGGVIMGIILSFLVGLVVKKNPPSLV